MAASGSHLFVADLHLGADADPGGVRERAFVQYLQSLPADLKALYLLGDIFDFWVDYRDVVPRGSVRVLAALAEVAQRADVWFFRGNHDWWVTDYFEKELGVHIVQEPWRVFEIDGRRVLAGHGDTLGSHDPKSKLIRCVFRNKVCIALLKALHPRPVFRFARSWSASSRKRHPEPEVFKGRETGLYRFADGFGRSNRPADLYVFGHYHVPGRVPVESGGELVVLGAWSGPDDTFIL